MDLLIKNSSTSFFGNPWKKNQAPVVKSRPGVAQMSRHMHIEEGSLTESSRAAVRIYGPWGRKIWVLASTESVQLVCTLNSPWVAFIWFLFLVPSLWSFTAMSK